jgi:hypothetical protein
MSLKIIVKHAKQRPIYVGDIARVVCETPLVMVV